MHLSRSHAVVLAGLLAASGTWASVAGQQRGQPLPPTGLGKGFLSGQVVDANSDRPIAGAQVVTVAVAGRIGAPQAPVVADSQGRFFFANLPAGSYQFQILKAGYSMITLQNYLRTIDLTEAERITTLKFRLVRLASIGGVVRDDGGDPVPGVDVMAFDRTVTNGRLSLRRFTQARTDDRGAYRLTSLRPGDYFVCACARDPIPFDGLLLTTLAADPAHGCGGTCASRWL